MSETEKWMLRLSGWTSSSQAGNQSQRSGWESGTKSRVGTRQESEPLSGGRNAGEVAMLSRLERLLSLAAYISGLGVTWLDFHLWID